MIDKPGWYIFDEGYSFSIIQVFKYFPRADCWSYNTLYSRKNEEKSINNGEDIFMFGGSTMHEMSEPILEYKYRDKLFYYIFDESDRFVMGSDYK